MKKLFLIFASFMLAVFCGCSDNGGYDFISSDGFYSSEGEMISELSQAEKEYLEELFDDAEWKDGMLKYRYGYVFSISDTIVEYTPDGAFYDRENDRSFAVSEEQRKHINDLFGIRDD